MRLYCLSIIRHIFVSPKLPDSISSIFFTFNPVRNKHILVLFYFVVIELWVTPLICVRVNDLKIKETFLCWFSYPVYVVLRCIFFLIILDRKYKSWDIWLHLSPSCWKRFVGLDKLRFKVFDFFLVFLLCLQILLVMSLSSLCVIIFFFVIPFIILNR